MGTFSQTNIRCRDMDTFLTELKKHLSIGRVLWMDSRKEWFFNLEHDENPSAEENTTIILTQHHSKDWIEAELDFDGNVYFYDEILRRISRSLHTVILLGYYQSTSGEGRIAKFENGQLELSFYERHFYFPAFGDDLPATDRVYVADNFGVKLSKIERVRSVQPGKDSSLIGYDLIYDFYESEGWTNDSVKDISDRTYLHIEQRNE